MFRFLLPFTLMIFALSFANAEAAKTEAPAKTCGQSAGPESMDPTIVTQICITNDGIEVTLRSGAVNNYPWVDFDPQDGEGVNVVTFSDDADAEFSMIYLTDKKGKAVVLEPIKDEVYPFHHGFSVQFKK